MAQEEKTEEEKQEIRENIQSETGKSFDEMKELASKALKIHRDAKAGKTDEEQMTSDSEKDKITEMSEKMKSSHLASDLIDAGFAMGDYSMGATEVEHATNDAVEQLKDDETPGKEKKEQSEPTAEQPSKQKSGLQSVLAKASKKGQTVSPSMIAAAREKKQK